MQDSLPAAGPALPDGIGYPQGSCERFHGCNDSPFPSFLRDVSSSFRANPGRVDLGGFPPRPPTDPDVHVNASGSSSQDFAAPLSRPWTTRAGGRR